MVARLHFLLINIRVTNPSVLGLRLGNGLAKFQSLWIAGFELQRAADRLFGFGKRDSSPKVAARFTQASVNLGADRTASRNVSPRRRNLRSATREIPTDYAPPPNPA
jgi:hypothetical protein